MVITSSFVSSYMRYWRGNWKRASLSERVMELNGLFIKRFCLLSILLPKFEGSGKSAVTVNYVHTSGVNFNMHVMFENVSRKDWIILVACKSEVYNCSSWHVWMHFHYRVKRTLCACKWTMFGVGNKTRSTCLNKVYYSFLENVIMKCSYRMRIQFFEVLTLMWKWSYGLKGKTAWCSGFTTVSTTQMWNNALWFACPCRAQRVCELVVLS